MTLQALMTEGTTVMREAPGLTQRERELAGIITAYNEVTERLKVAHERLTGEVMRLHEELRLKNEELRRRERLAALGEMAAGLAHEVRNPLGGIALYASMMQRELGSHPSAQTAGKIFQGVRSLEALVCEILEFAQEDRLDRRRSRLGAILAQSHDAVARIAEQEAVEVEIDVSAAKIEVYSDPDRLQRVLTNLLANAIQASGPGGRARVNATATDRGVQIEVTDSGAGIPEELRQRIFHPFFTTKASGTGLGLAICHRIVEAHGGTISAGNAQGGGARFVVWLPAEAESV